MMWFDVSDHILTLATRLGSCGGLIDTQVGTVLVPKASIAVNRNYDFDFVTGSSGGRPYRFSKPVSY